ncbi:MAG: winged helix-turn-helix transcriptional regulator [Hyphomonadaceae bacterium]|nr:winged helix-turn-helix transcriptional regulator [Hyphomonadaceae bacterium]
MARSTPDSSESDQFKLAGSPSHLLHRAEQLAAERFTQLVGDTIKLREFIILAAIAEKPGLSQTDLGRIAGVDRSTLADAMGKMEHRGWIVRTPSTSDGRAYSVLLGQAGGTMLSATTQHARAADAAILDLLPKTKGRSFINTLTKLAGLADAAAAKAEREQKKLAKRKARERAAEKKAKLRAASRKQRS